jgi:hypothetical protein
MTLPIGVAALSRDGVHRVILGERMLALLSLCHFITLCKTQGIICHLAVPADAPQSGVYRILRSQIIHVKSRISIKKDVDFVLGLKYIRQCYRPGISAEYWVEQLGVVGGVSLRSGLA